MKMCRKVRPLGTNPGERRQREWVGWDVLLDPRGSGEGRGTGGDNEDGA